MPILRARFRCTRPRMYPVNTPGHKDFSSRQGYYITAVNEHEARMEMCRMFPEDNGHFDITIWQEL